MADNGEAAPMGRGTRGVHVGQEPDAATGAVVPVLGLATTYAQAAPGSLSVGGWEYSRSGNPTRAALERSLASLEGAGEGQGGGALTFSSGLAATSAAMHLLGRGDRVLCADDVYGGTFRLLNRICQPMQDVGVDIVDMTDTAAALAAITPAHKLVWIETPTNPTLKVVDIEALSKGAKAVGARTVVDNTFASPYFQTPLDLGADLVLHSITKYINGHSDVVMGCLVTRDQALFDRLQFLQNAVGSVPAPFDCYHVLRSIRTLHLRMRQHEANALAVAQALEQHPKVARVSYPGLPSHPQHALAAKQMRGFSGMVTVWLKHSGAPGEGLAKATKFLQSLRFFCLAESLGGVEGLAEVPAVMTHASIPAEQRAQLGIDDAMCRLSCGVEDTEDLVADIHQALEKVE